MLRYKRNKKLLPQIQSIQKKLRKLEIFVDDLQYHRLKYFSFLQKYEPEEEISQLFEATRVIFLLDNKYTPKELKKIRGTPILNIDTPKRGIANKAAGTKPINVLNIAVKVSAAIISLIFIGAINKLVKFLLQISSRNIIL